MKPVQHEHTVEVKIPVPAPLQEKAELFRDHLEENKKPYAFGLGGLVLGFAISRIFASPSINIEIALPKD